MKFKLLSVVLLLVCFIFLGVLTDAIPVTELSGDTAAGLFSAFTAETAPSPSPTAASVMPTARTAPAATPERSAGPAPTPAPTDRPAVTPAGEDTPAPESASVPESTPAPEAAPVPESTPAPEAAPAPTAVPEAAEGPLWSPDVEVISTTITWNDPLQNETSYAVDGASLLDLPLELSLPEEGPQVLIIHTHGTEAYTPDGDDQYTASGEYRTLEADHSIIRVGQALAQALRSYGLDVLVDTELYDWPNYDGAYARSGDAIQAHIEAEPTIRVVIDLHRDALGDDRTVYKTVSDQVLPEAAQIMFVVGTDATLSHPGWRKNLDFAMSLQGLIERQYPHIMRPTLLSPNRYNQQLTPASVLLEIGTAGNTIQEALTSAELFAETVGPALAACIGA